MENKNLSMQDIFKIGAENGVFYSRFFFEKTCKNPSPQFHYDIWEAFLDPQGRQISMEIFRGGAKTSLARCYASQRIAYAISRTMLLVGQSQDQAKKNGRWLKKQILYNKKWSQFYKLEKGDKWTDDWFEIYNGIANVTISVVCVGITGQIRGLNLDDARPDFILVDDPCDEENTGTPEQRKKTSDLFFGALIKSLAPPTESPLARVCLLQTPLVNGDLITTCRKDPSWKHLTFSCLDENEESIWEERFTTEYLRKDKTDHINRNQLPLWLREMGCTITSELSAAFMQGWLQYWELGLLPDNMSYYMAIDPVPPPSPKELANGLKKKDYECLAVVGYSKGNYYLVDYRFNRGHNPDWTLSIFWELVNLYKITSVRVESVAYQRTLRWLIEKSMKEKRRYLLIEDSPIGGNNKFTRIKNYLNGVCSQGRFFVNAKLHSEFIEQFITFPDTEVDDILETVAVAVGIAQENAIYIEGEYEEIEEESYEYKQQRIPYGGYCP